MKLKFSIPLFFVIFFMYLPTSSLGQFMFKDMTGICNVGGYWFFGGHGVHIVDVDGDGDMDIYVMNVGGRIPDIPNLLFINYGNGKFVEEAKLRGLDIRLPVGSHEVVFYDWEGDGDPDMIYFTTPGEENYGYIKLLLNDGTGFFDDVTDEYFSQTSSISTRGTVMGYWDENKKKIGVIISNPIHYPYPWATELIGPFKADNFLSFDGERFTMTYCGEDFEGFHQGRAGGVYINLDDRYPDYGSASWGPPSEIFLNNGDGTFRKAGMEWGLPQVFGKKDQALVFGNANNDARIDLAVVEGNSKITIYMHMGDYFWPRQTLRRKYKGGFHCMFIDLDNDGDNDLFWPGEGVFENDGTGWFTRVENVEDLQNVLNMKDARGSAVFYYKGVQYIYMTDKKGYNILLRNEIDNSNRILIFIDKDHTGRRGGVNAEVYLYVDRIMKAYEQIIPSQGYLEHSQRGVLLGVRPYRGREMVVEIVYANGVSDSFKVESGKQYHKSYGYSLTIEAGENGTTDPAPGTHMYVKGGLAEVRAIANIGFVFDRWTGDVDEEFNKDNPLSTIMDKDKKIKPHFKPVSPPANFKAQRVMGGGFIWRRYVNVLTWEPNPANERIEIESYYIWQLQDDNSYLYIDEVSADTVKYLVKKDPTGWPIRKDKKYTYAISSISVDGFESEKAIVTIPADEVSKPQKEEVTEKKQGKKSSKGRR